MIAMQKLVRGAGTNATATASDKSQTWLPPVYLSVALFLYSLWTSLASEAGDFKEFRSWLIHIADVGPVYALGHPFSGYSPPYIYALSIVSPAMGWLSATALIKLVSCAGYVMLAFAVRHLLIGAGHRHADRAAALFMLVPSLFANFAIMNQCDAFWGAGIVMAMAAAMRRAHAPMLVWFGLAIAFKLQAVFAGPFILAIVIAHRVPLRLWFLAPAATALAYLPAWLAGWPLMDLLFVYFRQVGFFDDLSLNAPNIWMIIEWVAAGHSARLLWLTTPATLVAVAVCVAFVPWAQRHLKNAGPQTMLRIALIGAMLPPSILPRMHERYFLMVDIIALVLGLLDIRRYWHLVLFVQLGTTLAMIGHLTQLAIFATIGAFAMLYAMYLAIRLPWITENYTDPRQPRPAPWPTIPARRASRG